MRDQQRATKLCLAGDFRDRFGGAFWTRLSHVTSDKQRHRPEQMQFKSQWLQDRSRGEAQKSIAFHLTGYSLFTSSVPLHDGQGKSQTPTANPYRRLSPPQYTVM